MKFDSIKTELNSNGFATCQGFYSEEEVRDILSLIESSNLFKSIKQSSQQVYAIRRFLKEMPSLKTLLFNDKLKALLNDLFDHTYFNTKAIYFDKPEVSNWFVSYHQDISIMVDRKEEVEGYSKWTKKGTDYGVHPPLEILNNIVTVRIHLDDTTIDNGALKVISGSHKMGVYPSAENNYEKERVCDVERGGIMLMKPLIMHASERTRNKKQRRVIHLEFSDKNLKSPLNWSEKLNVSSTGT